MIEKYINQDFYIFPCNSNKAPIIEHGFKDATNNYDIAKNQFYKDGLLIGTPTGKINEIIIIDFDQNKKIPGTDIIDTRSVEELYDEVTSNYGELPDTFMVETPSKGRHYYYLLPKDVEISSGTRFLDKSLMVDIKAEGGYVIAPDNINYNVYDDFDNLGIDGIKSRCAMVPQWVIDFKKQVVSIPENLPANTLPESELREIRSALASIPSDDYETWYKMGMALKSTGSPATYGLFQEWSQKSDKYDPVKTEKKWKEVTPRDMTIATLFHTAKQNGWVTTYEKQNVITPTILPDQNKINQIQEGYKKKPFPKELLRPDGMVGDIIDYILSKSIVPQPVFALSAALCAVGTLAGRKVQTNTGIRTNIYCINVGESGSGKEAPRKAIKDLFQISGCGDLASVEDIASDSAIITEMKRVQSQLFLIDEIGRFIEATKNNRGASHLTKIIDVLLKMYGNANQIYYGKSYADEEKKATIIQPNLCLLGTTVPDNLYKGLTYESASDGFLARMLFFETDDSDPEEQIDPNFLIKPPKELIDQIKALHKKTINMVPEGNLDVLIPNPQVIPKDENATEMIRDLKVYLRDLRKKLGSESKIKSIYTRTAQTAEQVALIIATGIDIDNPVITEKEMAYGISLAKYLSDQMSYIIETYMAKNDHEHEVKRILKVVRDAGSISLQGISQKSQNLYGNVRNDILSTLIDSGQINEHSIGDGKYTRKIYTAI